MTAVDIARSVRAKDLSALEVTKAHLARLDVVNPKINAVVQEFPDAAIAEAQKVDAALARGEDPGPLCGVPVTIKINVDQAGHATTNGIRLQEELIAQSDSPVVSNIRAAGGVIVGRTNTPAFSIRWFADNMLHGQTLNPHNKDITPGGSSGGASSAVAAGICAIGHGTDIAGSIRYPAYACGLHGLRPSLGRIPAYNASAPDRLIGAQLMAVSGPIARTVADIELSLRAMMAPDARDPWYISAPFNGTPLPKRAALTRAPDGMPVADEVRAALGDAAEKLRDAGWDVQEVDCPPLRPLARLNEQLWMADTQLGMHDMVAREGDAAAQFVYRLMSESAGKVDFEVLMKALQSRAQMIREWELFMQRYPIVLCPVSGGLPFAQQLDISSEAAFADIMEAQLTQRALPVLGCPAMAVATGQAGGMPIGVQLIGAKFREDIVIAAGRDIERAGTPPFVVTPAWD
tara:strand:- start:18 stop:1400 length:1383 start_codon:yes stop_codon:yes gene_type:complete